MPFAQQAVSGVAPEKKVYNLSTRSNDGDKLPMDEDGLLDVEVLSILADATEKTQKPFLKRMLRFYRRVHGEDVDDPHNYLKNILRSRIKETLQMSDKVRAFLLLDYFREILPAEDANGAPIDIGGDLDWHNTMQKFKIKGTNTFLASNPESIENTIIYGQVDDFALPDSLIERVIVFLYLQLIFDVITNRAQNDHVAPVINRLKSERHDIDRVFDLSGEAEFWDSNIAVVNLDQANLEMKKTLPLLLAKKLYADHKQASSSSWCLICVSVLPLPADSVQSRIAARMCDPEHERPGCDRPDTS